MSNTFATQESGLLEQMLALRHQMLAVLTDEDLVYKLPNNPSLGAVCREMVEIEQVYIQSFKTFKMEWGYKAPNVSDLETKLDVLKSTFAAQEQAFREAIAAPDDATVEKQTIDRGHGFNPTMQMQFHIYREALLIFYGRAGVYLCALEKQLPDQWQQWIW